MGYSNSSWVGGPSYTDAWGSKRAPSPPELIEHFKSLVYSCVKVNANAVSSVPLRLYVDASTGPKIKDDLGARSLTRSQFSHLRAAQYIGSGNTATSVHEVRDHPFLRALNDPGGGIDLSKLLKAIVMYGDVVGASYVQPEGIEGRPYRWLWVLASQHVLPLYDSTSALPSGYTYGAKTYKLSELLCFRHHLSLKNLYAANYSPLYAAVEYAKLEDKFVSIQEQLMAQGPRPNLLVSPSDPNQPPGPQEKERFEQDLNRKHARGAQGGVLVTTGFWDVKPITYSPTDLAGLKIAELDFERICGCFGVPLEFFTSDTNLANQQAAREKHALLTVDPWCKSIASQLTQIIQQWDYRFFFAFDNSLPANEEQEAKTWDIRIKNGSATINEANAECGLSPKEYGDEPWQPSTLVQPSMQQKLNEATIAASTLAAVGSREGGGSSAVGNKDVKKGKSKAKGGASNGKKKPSGDDNRTRNLGDPGDLRLDRSVLDQGDAAVHGVEGLTTEDEDRDPFAHLEWSVDPPSAASD